ncbi:MAG: YraN family protein [Candidatus Peribacteraceae bacterium]
MEPSSPPSSASHLLLGREGEDIVEHHLHCLGWDIQARNVRVGRRDEIDLIAREPVDDVLVFVEVKTRREPSDVFPARLGAHYRKRQNMLRAARRWVAQEDYQGGYRVDLVCVEGGRVTQHTKGINARGRRER